jgi:hypothetical protein
MTTTQKMEQKFDIFKIWPPDFAQKNIKRILNLFKTICILIFPKNFFFFFKYRFLKKTSFVPKIAHEFFFVSITFDPNNQNTSMISFLKGL